MSLGEGTPVLLADGRVLPVEQIMIGDRLMGPDSTARMVASTTAGRAPLFRVEPVKGEALRCNDHHVLTLVHSMSNVVIDIPLDQWLLRHSTFKRNHKLFSVGVEPFANVSGTSPPVDPYFLGVWFGDGGTAIQTVVISKPDPEIFMLCEEQARHWGLHVSVQTSNGTRCPSYHLAADAAVRGEGGKSGERSGRWRPNPLLHALRNLLGTEIKMPPSYLHASRTVRLQFLAGLCDTDGELADTTFVITQKREDWAREIWRLGRSLGFFASFRSRIGRCKKADGTLFEGTYWVVSISGDTDQIPTRIARKKAAPRRQKKIATRTGVATVVSIGEGPCWGFTFEGNDGKFLLGDFTVTSVEVDS